MLLNDCSDFPGPSMSTLKWVSVHVGMARQDVVTVVLVSVPGKPAVSLARIRNAQDRVYFPMKQFHADLLTGLVIYQACCGALQSVSHASIIPANDAVRARLSALKALEPKAKAARLVSLATLLEGLRKLDVSHIGSGWHQLSLATPKQNNDIVAMKEAKRWMDADEYGRFVHKVGA